MQESNKKNVLVTGVGGPAGINALRLLQNEKNVHVIGCDIDELSAGQFFADKFLISPRVSSGVEYQTWLKGIIQQYKVDLLIPTVDEELPVVSVLASQLSCLTIVSKEDAIVVGNDKVRLYQWAENNIPNHLIPWTLLSDWTAEWMQSEEQFIKPRQGRGGRGCLKVSKTDLQHLKKIKKKPSDFIVMEFMSGIEWTVDAYCSKSGSMIYVVPRERIGLSGGIAIKGRTVRHQQLIELSSLVCKKIGFYGPVCLQWRADKNGVPRLIEINPRLSGGLPISVLGGINPIKSIMQELHEEDPLVQNWNEVTVIGHFEYKKYR